MKGYIQNPNEQVVALIKKQVRDNNGYCIYAQEHSKQNKCPKPCKKSGQCMCGMYVPDNYEPEEYDLD